MNGYRSDRGSGSLWLLGIGLAVLSFAVLVAQAGSALVAGHRAQVAADFGALAAAGRAVDGPGAACGRADRIVRANGAVLRDCRLDGLDAVVETTAEASFGPVGGRARAGPVRA